MAPSVGVLWTPGYWGWGGGAYIWHAGYWGPHVGFYGGINYGFGYGGVGFVGGTWRGGVFAYNTAVTNVNTTVIHNTYVNRTTVINNTTLNRVSYNGGTGGINARPTPEEQVAEHEQHIPASSVQMQHEQAARTDHTMLASVNHGQPAVAATAKPGVFRGEGVVAARAAGPSQNHPVPRPPNANRPSENVASNHATQNGGVPRPRTTIWEIPPIIARTTIMRIMIVPPAIPQTTIVRTKSREAQRTPTQQVIPAYRGRPSPAIRRRVSIRTNRTPRGEKTARHLQI